MKRKSFFKVFRFFYQKLIANKKEEVNFWILIAFILTFTASRLIVYFFPDLNLHVKGVHIHHFSYGILILSIVGLLSLNDWHHKKLRSFVAMFGIGLGLAMDEFGMWIHLDDNYWIRHSYDAIFITSAILIFIVYFQWFWQRIIKRVWTQKEEEDEDLYWSET